MLRSLGWGTLLTGTAGFEVHRATACWAFAPKAMIASSGPAAAAASYSPFRQALIVGSGKDRWNRRTMGGEEGVGKRVETEIRLGQPELSQKALDALVGITDEGASDDPLGRAGSDAAKSAAKPGGGPGSKAVTEGTGRI